MVYPTNPTTDDTAEDTGTLMEGFEMDGARLALQDQLRRLGIEIPDDAALRIAAGTLLGYAMRGGLDERCLIHVRAAVREMHAMMGH